MTTTHVCRHLLPTGRRITVKIANERPESHYLNRVAMRRVDVPDGCELVADDEGGLLLASGGIPCARAVEPRGGDAAQAIAAADREYWAGQAVSDAFEDVLELKFPHPEQVTAAALVITSPNTELADAVFNELFGCLGEDAPQFYRALDQDPERQENPAWAVQAMDETYCVLLPGDDLTLVFTDDREERGGAGYVLDVGGYLYEWPRLTAAQASLPPAAGSAVVAGKMVLVKRLIASRGTLLSLVYARWNR